MRESLAFRIEKIPLLYSIKGALYSRPHLHLLLFFKDFNGSTEESNFLSISFLPSSLSLAFPH